MLVDDILNRFREEPYSIQTLMLLGFNGEQITEAEYLLANGINGSVRNLTGVLGYDYGQASRISQLMEMMAGRMRMDTDEDLARHLRKINGGTGRVGINNLLVSTIREVPSFAVIAGIRDRAFGIYNSNNYPTYERLYDVVKVTNSRIHVETDRRPILKYGEPKLVEGVIEILDDSRENIILAVNKDYATLCNRFIVVASLRRPQFHMGMVEIICREGTRVYVYARDIGTKTVLGYSMVTQRIYAYGTMAGDVKEKLMLSYMNLYRHLGGGFIIHHEANQDFSPVTLREADVKYYGGIEE